MIKEVQLEVWNVLNENTAVCILTNNMVLTNGKNIMGGGIAKEARDRNPGLEFICGQSIKNNSYSLGYDSISGAEMLRFPTKHVVYKDSDLDLISQSLYMLKDYCLSNPNKIVYLPRPGCGLGSLNWEDDVKPLCELILKNIENVIVVSK